MSPSKVTRHAAIAIDREVLQAAVRDAGIDHCFGLFGDDGLRWIRGAKIGVLGLNGAGKSSLLKIVSGQDQTFLGEAFPADGVSIGFLHWEPRLDPAKTVLENVEEGVAEHNR